LSEVIFKYRPHQAPFQAGGIVRVILEHGETVTIETANPLRGSDPNPTFPVLQNTMNLIIGQAMLLGIKVKAQVVDGLYRMQFGYHP
jgi:hypothetical protein